MHYVAARSVGCQRSALHASVEVNRIVVPAKDQRATAELLAYILGLEVQDEEPGRFVRVRAGNELTLDFSEPKVCGIFQCAFLLSAAEFDSALARMRAGCINFYAAFDGKGRGELNRQHGGRGLYFTDPDNHLFELIEQPDNHIKAVAIKFLSERAGGASRG
jgi:hypothetical protein